MFPQPLQPPLLWKPFCVSNHFCCLSPDPFCSCYIILKRIDQRGAHHSRQVRSTDLCAGTIMLSAIFLMSFFPEFSSDICWWLFKTSRVLLTVGAAVPFSSGPSPFRTSTVLPLLLFRTAQGFASLPTRIQAKFSTSFLDQPKEIYGTCNFCYCLFSDQ